MLALDLNRQVRVTILFVVSDNIKLIVRSAAWDLAEKIYQDILRSNDMMMIAVSLRWRKCVRDCCSFWSATSDSNYAFMLARIVLQFSGSKHIIKPWFSTHQSQWIWNSRKRNISEKLITERGHITSEQCDIIWNAIKSSAERILWCSYTPIRSINLIELSHSKP